MAKAATETATARMVNEFNAPPWLGGRGRETTLGQLAAIQTAELPPPEATGAIAVDGRARTFDCAPTLTDSQVLDFCRTGVLLLPGVVPDDVNARARDYLEGRIESRPQSIPAGMTVDTLERMRGTGEPSGILLEPWFIEGVLLQPQLAGALRSLLGAGVGLPVVASHHGRLGALAGEQSAAAVTEPVQAAAAWHQDADCLFGPELNFLEVFYFPQDTPPEAGPTEVVPGTQNGRVPPVQKEEGYEHGDAVLCAGGAGTLAIHHQSILHRRAAITVSQPRHMLKCTLPLACPSRSCGCSESARAPADNYWRTSAPRRDWVVQPDFDLQTAYYGGHDIARFVAHSLFWLHGRGDDYRIVGGQAWPASIENQIGPSWGFPGHGEQAGHEGVGSIWQGSRGYTPDWGRQNTESYYYTPAPRL